MICWYLILKSFSLGTSHFLLLYFSILEGQNEIFCSTKGIYSRNLNTIVFVLGYRNSFEVWINIPGIGFIYNQQCSWKIDLFWFILRLIYFEKLEHHLFICSFIMYLLCTSILDIGTTAENNTNFLALMGFKCKLGC